MYLCAEYLYKYNMEVDNMINYREILRLKSQGYSQRQIESSIGSSRSTIREVIALAEEKELEWPFPADLTNDDLKKFLYPGRVSSAGRQTPDYAYVHQELAKPGVTLTLLWSEYWLKPFHTK